MDIHYVRELASPLIKNGSGIRESSLPETHTEGIKDTLRLIMPPNIGDEALRGNVRVHRSD